MDDNRTSDSGTQITAEGLRSEAPSSFEPLFQGSFHARSCSIFLPTFCLVSPSRGPESWSAEEPQNVGLVCVCVSAFVVTKGVLIMLRGLTIFVRTVLLLKQLLILLLLVLSGWILQKFHLCFLALIPH